MPPIIIGLTGAFGSGCSIAAQHLASFHGFKHIRLSDQIKKKWAGNGPPSRTDLQKLGDQLRQADGLGVLVDAALADCGVLPEKIVVDGIRNVGEVDYLRARFGQAFTLVAVLSSTEARWTRIGAAVYNGDAAAFSADDRRDRNEETLYGQQVELCIDAADFFIDNSDTVLLKDFLAEVKNAADLLTGASPRPPRQSEIHMNMAYSASHSSRCLKRNVGAVVVGKHGRIVGTGYNENPPTTKPCVEEPEYQNKCFRDIVRNSHFRNLHERGAVCPTCAKALPLIEGPPWQCPACQADGRKTNLEAVFFPDRALNWCTAIHAEAAALTDAGERARDGTLYTTTYPCMQCAEKITDAGISLVVYTEAYPDPHSEQRLSIGKVKVERFRGVRSSSFDRIFKPRPT